MRRPALELDRPSDSTAQARARAEEEDYSPTEDNDASYVPQREDDEEVDDRLYCVCQQLYDPERMMIACDRCALLAIICSDHAEPIRSCDEWYHLDVRADDQMTCDE